MPAEPHDETSIKIILDAMSDRIRNIKINLKETAPYVYMSSINFWISAVLQCNTNKKLIHSAQIADYVTCYMTKQVDAGKKSVDLICENLKKKKMLHLQRQ